MDETFGFVEETVAFWDISKRRANHLHPVPGPVGPDTGGRHRQAGCHVNQQCSDETLGHPAAWYHVLSRLGINGWFIKIRHDQREAK